MMPPHESTRVRRIMNRVAPDDFIGRAAQLQQIASLAESGASERGLFLLAAPTVGASELLRQSYDQLFHRHANIAPFYFAFSAQDISAAASAQRFLQAFLTQWIAFRRFDSSLANASLTVAECVEMAPPADAVWIERLAEICEQSSGDTDQLVHACIGALERAATHTASVLVLIDDAHLIENLNGGAAFGRALTQTLLRSGLPFVLSGLRRKMLDFIDAAQIATDHTATLHLQRLDEPDAHRLIERLARRNEVSINDQTRDLIAQQLSCNPFYIGTLIQAAREQKVSLTSFLNCQQLYVDELMGGRLHRYFSGSLESAAPQALTSRALIRTLYESAGNNGGGSGSSKSAIEVWRKRIGLEADALQSLLGRLDARELINVEADFVEVPRDSLPWMDYLQARYRLDVATDARVLVVAETLRRCLKRAPETMARHYRKESAIDLKDVLSRFDCQRVPASLLSYEKFARLYRGAEAADINNGLGSETDLVGLPQAVHVAGCAAFDVPAGARLDDERCGVAHCFDAGAYTDASEVVWLAAHLESKTEAGRALTQLMCDRLESFAQACGMGRVRLWLIAPEGFTAEACELLDERGAYGSSLRQVGLLQTLLKRSGDATNNGKETAPDEFEMVIPMGEDTELIAAHTLEHIARRINFLPEAINQIKTALVEACINAAEHSHSPDRKIYQQFLVGSDRLTVTVSSRGVVVAPESANEPPASQQNTHNEQGGDRESERRGWGLKLIRTLMDEVEFERVDDGSRLRMTKYLLG
jgi:serine/threonine-protein kinase RsbW